jgi:uncharacterized membrane protein
MTNSGLNNREAIRGSIREFSRPSGTFWLMNALATTIACYALLSNSAAVVTGAMAAAMLLGAGVAPGLTDKDRGRGAMYDALRRA